MLGQHVTKFVFFYSIEIEATNHSRQLTGGEESRGWVNNKLIWQIDKILDWTTQELFIAL